MTKKRILVIDDELSIREMLKKALELNDFTVETAANGQLGFEKAVTDDVDLVIMDIKMPHWNGIEAIGSFEIVKPELKIIILSGYIQEYEGKKLSKAPNVIATLKKPFLIKNLLEEIKKGLQNKD